MAKSPYSIKGSPRRMFREMLTLKSLLKKHPEGFIYRVEGEEGEIRCSKKMGCLRVKPKPLQTKEI